VLACGARGWPIPAWGVAGGEVLGRYVVVAGFIDTNGDQSGVEPICTVLRSAGVRVGHRVLAGCTFGLPATEQITSPRQPAALLMHALFETGPQPSHWANHDGGTPPTTGESHDLLALQPSHRSPTTLDTPVTDPLLRAVPGPEGHTALRSQSVRPSGIRDAATDVTVEARPRERVTRMSWAVVGFVPPAVGDTGFAKIARTCRARR
jgi:hypothetical protein